LPLRICRRELVHRNGGADKVRIVAADQIGDYVKGVTVVHVKQSAQGGIIKGCTTERHGDILLLVFKLTLPKSRRSRQVTWYVILR